MAHPTLSADVRPALLALDEALQGIARGVDCDGMTKRTFALAFSGGMDSRFLAHAAQLLGYEVSLLMAVGPHVSPDEAASGEDWARRRGMDFQRIAVDPLHLPLVASNDRQRCYACKREMLIRLREAVPSSLPLCDGTNASDIHVFRPGTQAVRELGVLSPLVLAGLTKNDIYHLARLSGMERPDQRPRPCMLTRLPYGMRPTRDMLCALADGERIVRDVLKLAGLQDVDFRLRILPKASNSLETQLHMLTEEIDRLSPELQKKIACTVSKHVAGLLGPVRLLAVKTLSGFFDIQDDVKN